MGVVSVSLPAELIEEMDAAAVGGRSAFVRAALRHYLQEQATWEGHIHGSITVAYPHGHEAKISEVRHAFHNVVLSLMHTHCEPKECMDVLLVGGPADRVALLHQTLLRMRGVARAILVPVTSRMKSADADGGEH